MKEPVIALVFIFLACFNSGNNENDRIFNFGEYSLKSGINEKGSFIQLIKNEKVLIERYGGDGYYHKVDTADLNGDGRTDFVYSEILEDNFNVGLIVSTFTGKYRFESLGDYFSPDIYCEDFLVSDTSALVDFIVKDLNNDRIQEIMVNCLIRNNEIKETCLTDTIYFK